MNFFIFRPSSPPRVSTFSGDPDLDSRSRFLLVAGMTFYLLFLSSPLHALNVEQFRLVFDGQGLVNLSDSQTLSRRDWSGSAGLSYSHDPLQVETTPGVSQPVVHYHVNMTLTGAYGINDRISAGLALPLFPTLSIQPVGSATAGTDTSLGDLGLWGKFHLWDREKGESNMGLAVLPYITIPTGSTSNFTGDESLTGGFKAAYDAEFRKNKLIANVGLRFRKEENLTGLAVGQEFLFGAGYTRPVWEEGGLSALTEFVGSTSFNGFLSEANRMPMEWLFGLKKDFEQKGRGEMFLTAGGSVGLGSGYGTPDYRLFSLLTYQMGSGPNRPQAAEELAQVEGEQIVILQPIHFATGRWVILPESYPVAEAVAGLLQSRPDIRRVEVQGHTDHRGSVAYNLNLSRRRANAVVAKLVELGVETERLYAVGRGESQPVAEGVSAGALAKNRRVEFHIIEVRQGLRSRARVVPQDVTPNVEDY